MKNKLKFLFSRENMPAGQALHTVVVIAHGDMVDKVMPGDYHRHPTLRWEMLKLSIKTHIDVVHYRKLDQKFLTAVADDDM